MFQMKFNFPDGMPMHEQILAQTIAVGWDTAVSLAVEQHWSIDNPCFIPVQLLALFAVGMTLDEMPEGQLLDPTNADGLKIDHAASGAWHFHDDGVFHFRFATLTHDGNAHVRDAQLVPRKGGGGGGKPKPRPQEFQIPAWAQQAPANTLEIAPS
jgi:hypothetical protein